VTTYADFFEGSATVAGALIGLLFVALSLAPERLRDNRSIEHQAIAATAFTALVDALFVSLIALQPGSGVEYALIIFGALGLSSTIGLATRLWRSRHQVHLSSRWSLFIGIIICVYAAQLASGLIPDTSTGYNDRASTFVYIMFAVGIARAWQLLGLKTGGVLDALGVTLFPPHIQDTPSDPPPERETGADPDRAQFRPGPSSAGPTDRR
jgi:hypothetical protein